MSIIPKQATGTGDYYLAPSVQFAKIGMGNHVTEMTYIDENGDNHYGLDNILKTHLKVMPLDIHYNSSNARDNYADMGHWRTSFTSRMDFPINEGDIKDKSNFYDTPRDACESGFGDIKESAYRGILKDATSVYDKDHDMCVLKQEGKDIGTFIVWNRSQKREDVHYIETATQEFLTFVKNDAGKFVSEQSGVALELTKEADGSYSYKDAQDILRRYNSEGKLVYLMKEGQEAHLTYDANGKLDKVTGALDNVIDFNYNDKNLVSEIVGNGGTIKLLFAYDDKSLLSSYQMNFLDGNNSARTLIETNYAYDTNNMLSMVKSPARTTPEGEEILSSIVYYKYDDQNRISAVESDGSVQRIAYTATKVTKSLPNNTTAIANLTFVDGKQAITDSTDSHVATEFSFNKEGLLADVALREQVKVEDNTSSNIQSNALKTKEIKLSLQMDYNTHGLIKSQYLETSDGKKSFKNFEYKTKYNKPTKILTEDDVTFFDFNNKGQLIKKSYLKYDKDMKIKPHALAAIKQEVGYQEKSYTYDENGLISTHKNEITGEEKKFYADKSGKLHKGNIQANWFGWGWGWWWSWSWTPQVKGEISGVGTFNMQDPANTQTVFVGGAGDGDWFRNVFNYSRSANGNPYFAQSTFYRWYQIDPWASISSRDRFNKKDGKKLMVIGHSYGGDSSVEASKLTSAGKQVDLLITVDPIGTADWNDGAKHWIELYADPGRWYGYVRVKWVRRWWGGYPKFYWEPMQWNFSDWVAWAGGKGSYSTYDPGDAYPDKLWRTAAHHEDFAYMLQEFQKSETKYDFGINGFGTVDKSDEYK